MIPAAEQGFVCQFCQCSTIEAQIQGYRVVNTDMEGLVTSYMAHWLINGILGCAVKGAGPQRELNPSGNWFAPPGSNQSSRGGNETAEASGAESR
jgi:hypothetical protein